MLELAVAQFAGGLGKGLGDGIGGGGGGPIVSGGGALDARSFQDGSGWTVATGGSRAKGGTVGPKSQDGALQAPPGYAADAAGAGGMSQAGVSPVVAGVMLAMVAGGYLWSRRKG